MVLVKIGATDGNIDRGQLEGPKETVRTEQERNGTGSEARERSTSSSEKVSTGGLS